MDDFKKFLEELPSFTQKVRLANESISLAKLSDAEKQHTFMRLVLLKDATESLIGQLQEDLNKCAGKTREVRPCSITLVRYGNLDGIKDILNAVFDQYGNVREEDSNNSSEK